jgi:hypothetical protein
MTAFGQAENGDSGPLFELGAEALPAFALEEDGPPLERFLEEVGFTVELSEYRDNPSATRTSTR